MFLVGLLYSSFHLWGKYTFTLSDYFTIKYNRDPTVNLAHPNGVEEISGTYEISWTGTDPDGDTLHFTLEYNIDDTGREEIASVLITSSYNWDATTVLDSDSVRLRIIAEDGYGGFSIDKSDAEFSIKNGRIFIPGYEIGIILSLIDLFISRELKLNKYIEFIPISQINQVF